MDTTIRPITVLLLSLTLLLSPFSSAAEVEDVPLSPGSTWTYRDLEGNRETLSVGRILARKGIPLVEASYDSGAPFHYIITEDGIYRLEPAPESTTDVPRGTLTLLVRWPLEPGETWESPWSDPPLSFTVLDRGPVTVPAGVFRRSVKIGYRRTTSPIYQGYLWFDPSVGLLAHEESDHRTELVSYSLSDLLPPAPVLKTGEELARVFRPRVDGNGPGGQKSGRRTLETLFSGPSFLFILLASLLALATLLYMRSRRVDVELNDDPHVQEGETTLASAMVREGLYQEAAGILQRITARHPQWPDVAALLGRAYRETGKLQEACLELKRALTLNPNLSKARLELVRTYLQLSEPARALEEVETVLSDNHGFADAFYLRGEVLLAMGKEDEALESFRDALDINPSFTEAQEALERLLSEQE